MLKFFARMAIYKFTKRKRISTGGRNREVANKQYEGGDKGKKAGMCNKKGPTEASRRIVSFPPNIFPHGGGGMGGIKEAISASSLLSKPTVFYSSGSGSSMQTNSVLLLIRILIFSANQQCISHPDPDLLCKPTVYYYSSGS
jgi:hypothetical protein